MKEKFFELNTKIQTLILWLLWLLFLIVIPYCISLIPADSFIGVIVAFLWLFLFCINIQLTIWKIKAVRMNRRKIKDVKLKEQQDEIELQKNKDEVTQLEVRLKKQRLINELDSLQNTTCSYCGCKIGANDTICSHCGASKKPQSKNM